MELKSFGISAMSVFAIVLSSCSANDDFEDLGASSAADNNVIGFRVKTSGLTRSGGIHIPVANPSNFMVAAMDGNTSLFGPDAEKVNRAGAGDSWVSNRLPMWPTGKTSDWNGLSFYAFMDGKTGESGRQTSDCFDLSDGASFRDFEVAADVARQSDLMYAVAKDVKQTSFNGDVSLNFRHALSTISFTAQNNHPYYEEIEILSIEFGGIKGKGTYFFPENSTDAAENGYYRTVAASKGTWAIDENAADCSYTLKDININIGKPDASGRGGLYDLTAMDNGRSSEISSSNTMYLIPQKVEARASEDSNEGAYIKVTARMVMSIMPDVEQVVEKFIPVSVNWQEGKSYTYHIAWDAVPITFSATIDDYSDVTVTQD